MTELLAVFVGGLLTATGFLTRSRKERKGRIGQALLSLLVTHRLLMFEVKNIALAIELAGKGQLSNSDEQRLLEIRAAKYELPDVESLVNEIAAIDPFLAFTVRRHVTGLASVLERSGTYLKLKTHERFLQKSLIEMEHLALKAVEEELRKVIITLSWSHSIRAWFKAKNHLRTDEESQTIYVEGIAKLYRVQDMIEVDKKG